LAPQQCFAAAGAPSTDFPIAPDGDVGQQAFAAIREAIRKEGMQRRVQRQDIRPTPKEGHSVNWQAKDGELRWLGVSTQ
jgi:hypothetical protein